MALTSGSTEIEALRRLDEADQLVLKLEREIADAPLELRRYQDKVAKGEAALDKVLKQQKELQRQIDAFDLDTRTNKDTIGKYRGQQNTAKSNDEYAALKRQIVALEEKNAAIEDKALALYEELDGLKLAEKSARADLAELKGVLDREKAEVDKEVEGVKAELVKAQAARKDAMSRVSEGALRTYDRIRDRVKGRAMANLSGNVCLGCHTQVPSNIVANARLAHELVACTQCTRILLPDRAY